MRLGIVAHPRKKAAREAAVNLINGLSDKGGEGADITLVLEDGLHEKLHIEGLDTARLEDMEADIVVCIGGDGTILRTLQLTSTPVLGINAGSLGFLMDVNPSEMDKAVEALLNGRYSIEERTKLRTTLNDEPLPDAVNEAVLITGTPSKIQDYDLSIDGEHIHSIRADGVIVSTPTGSTSYALSAGGSVIDPRIGVFEIIPIAPFRVNSRPLIIPDDSIVNFRVAHRTRTAFVVIDGNFKKRIAHKDLLRFTKAKQKARFVRLKEGFYSKLNEKIFHYMPTNEEKR